jgi:hypothetical protein
MAMRSRDFLFEYKRDITAKNLGNNLLKAMMSMDKAQNQRLPWQLGRFALVVDVIKNPESSRAIGLNFNLDGKEYLLSKDNASEILDKSKSKIVRTLLMLIEFRDPTRNKQFVPWLVRMFINSGGNLPLEDMNRNAYLTLFLNAKNQNLVPVDFRDINKFKTYKEFEDFMDATVIPELDRKSQEEMQELVKGKAKEVWNDDQVRVIIPQDQDAACYYGQSTRWCTASTRGNNLFTRYNATGPLYILIPKNPNYPGEKYQLHFIWDQFMNEKDEPVDLTDIVNRFFRTGGAASAAIPPLQKYIEFAPGAKLEKLWKELTDYLVNAYEEQIPSSYRSDDMDLVRAFFDNYDSSAIKNLVKKIFKHELEFFDLPKLIGFLQIPSREMIRWISDSGILSNLKIYTGKNDKGEETWHVRESKPLDYDLEF